MTETNSFVGFLEGLYGRSAVDQIAKISNIERKDLEAAGDAFMPTFLQSLMKARSKSHMSSGNLGETVPSFGTFWPQEMVDAMQDFTSQSADAAKQFSTTPSTDNSAFPFNMLAAQSAPMEKLYQTFLGQASEAQLIDEASKSTGLPASQLKTLFPVLTTYGLIPLMPQLAAPAMDDPAGWVDYLGDMGRRNLRQANRELDAMPSPFSAAFDGLLAGFFPKSAEPEPQSAPPDQAQQVRDASLELQANYIKGLNGLFESYQASLSDKPQDD